MAFIILLTFSVLLGVQQLHSASVDHNGVREGPRDSNSNRSNGVRDFVPSSGVQPAKAPAPAKVPSISNNADGSNISAPAVSSAAGGQVAANSHDPNSFAGIRDEFVGGMTAIRDSTGKLVGFAANTVKEGVVAAVRPVVDFGANVVNKTVQIKDNIGNAGHQLVHTWGTSLSETGNITSQLFNNVAGR